MYLTKQSDVTRRDLLRLSAVSGFAAVVLPSLLEAPAKASVSTCPLPCNYRPTSPSDAFNTLMCRNAKWASLKPGKDLMIPKCAPTFPQTPFAAILACVDSRVPPELVFESSVGELFTARVAGNSVVPILEDSLAYGTEHLGAMVLFVLGHQDCGAVSAAVQFYLENLEQFSSWEDFVEGSSFESETFSQGGFENSNFSKPAFAFIPPILPAVRVARKIVKQNGGNPNDPGQVTPCAIKQHVILTVDKLSSREPFKDLVKQGKLMVTGGVYDLSTSNGIVEVLPQC